MLSWTWYEKDERRDAETQRKTRFPCGLGVSALVDAIGTASVGFLQRRNGLSPRVAGVDLVPVADLLFAQLPAQVDVAGLVAADEVDQADLVVLQLAADLAQLVDEVFQPAHGRVELGLGGRLVLGAAGLLHLGLEPQDQAVGFDDVADDAADERQRAVRL